MSKKLTKTLFFSALLMSFTAQSALTLSGTRYVYSSDTKAIPVTVTNHADTVYGAQIWIENSVENGVIPFSVSPGVFTLKANKGTQAVQVAQLEADAKTLPEDRESLFFVNLQEIPPKAQDSMSKNVLVMASRTVVKLFYRPASLSEGREKAEQKIRISQKGTILTFENPTPYFFAMVSINGDDKLATEKLNKMAPFTRVSVEMKGPVTGKISFKAIDDFGGLREYQCDLNKKHNQCQHVKTK